MKKLGKLFIIISLVLLLFPIKSISAEDTPIGYVTQKEFSEFISKFNDKSVSSYISVKDYVDSRFSAIQDATKSARDSMERRLDGMNEFRASLKDQADRFVGREEHSVIINKLDERIKIHDSDLKSLEITRAVVEGKASQTSVTVTFIFALLGVFISTASLVILIKQGNLKNN